MKNYSRTTSISAAVPNIKKAKANGLNKLSKFKGNTLKFLLNFDSYQSLYKEVKKVKKEFENNKLFFFSFFSVKNFYTT